MRATFENRDSQMDELRIVRRFTTYLKEEQGQTREFKKMPIYSPVDFAICNSRKVTGWLEVRSQNFNYDDHRHVVIDLRKLYKLRDWAEWSTDAPVYFAVGFTDGLTAVASVTPQIEEHIIDVKWMNRKRPRDDQDNAPAAWLSKEMFTLI